LGPKKLFATTFDTNVTFCFCFVGDMSLFGSFARRVLGSKKAVARDERPLQAKGRDGGCNSPPGDSRALEEVQAGASDDDDARRKEIV
jgi:hypothetical protein